MTGRITYHEWTDEELWLLRRWFPVCLDAACEALPHLTRQAVKRKASREGIAKRRKAKMRNTSWTNEEREILRRTYPEGVDAAMAALPGRSMYQIKNQARYMGIRVSADVLKRKAIENGKQSAVQRRKVTPSTTGASVLNHWSPVERVALFGRWV